MSAYSEEMISAFVDGELDPAAMAQMEAAAAQDAELSAQIEAYRRNDAILLRAVDDLLNETVAAPAVPAAASDGSNVIAFRRKEPAAATSRRWVPAAVAAGLALVIGVYGTQVYFGNAARQPAQDGLAANASFSAALSRLASGETGKVDGGTIRVALSFRAKDKRYCREFAVGFANGSGAGVACNAGGSWQIEGWASSPAKAGGEYRTAGGPDDSVLDTVIHRLGVEQPLDRTAESNAIQSGWAQGR